MSKIPISKKGVILDCEQNGYLSRQIGWDIIVEPTGRDETSFLILYISPNGKEGYDDWVKDEKDLERFFEAHKLKVDWTVK